eukprot:TRINITY_DN1990_c0_g2_i12.p1 TRINITY_DN1990_c0_g2~~TRINITY_DN1990_c0_g2_i12.p1  ORF type:complete len:332 (+),score=19.62 TRINITY_DN1990_c0_g2_i12:178-1173(+)
MTLILYCLFGCITLIYLYGYRILTRIRLRHIPGPQPQWLLGNLAGIKHLPEAQTEWAKTFGPICKFFVGGRAMISVSDPELCRKLLMKTHQRPLNEMTQPSAGIRRKYQVESLFWSRGQQFKRLKSAWQVAFNQGSVHNYFPLMQRHANQLCEAINEKAKTNEAFNIHGNIQKMTLEVVGSTAFGIELGLLSEEGGAYGIQAEKLLDNLIALTQASSGSSQKTPWSIMNHLFPEIRFLWAQLSQRIPLTENEKNTQAAINGLVRDSRTIIKNERIKRDSSQDQEHKNISGIQVDPGSFIANLIKTKDVNSGQMLTDDQIGAQAYVFFASRI